MKVHSLTILHYGKDYLSYALRSVYHSVDRLNIFYTPEPSHGHATNLAPPETKTQLMKAAFAYDPDDKVKWYDMLSVTHEGKQRDLALERCQENGAELVVVVDYDEIWHRRELKSALVNAWESNFRNHLINMMHFWRSFNWVCYDDGWPVRIIDLRASNKAVSYIPRETAQVYHFGYAVRDAIMKYKWQIHGHKNELRSDWLNEIWADVRKDDIHPTNEKEFWNAYMFDKSELPEFMREHPFYNLEIID